MDITTRSVFMVGGTSGIGLELARRFRAAGSTVVVGGRRTDVLARLAEEGLSIVEIDVTDPDSVSRARDEVLRTHPDLDTVVTMSGTGLPEDVRDPAHFAAASMSSAPSGSSMHSPRTCSHAVAARPFTVSSGIGFLPFPVMPTYGASVIEAVLAEHKAGSTT